MSLTLKADKNRKATSQLQSKIIKWKTHVCFPFFTSLYICIYTSIKLFYTLTVRC